jgi:hypothetical protein
MELLLDSREVAALRALLDAHFDDLTSQISHTDNPAYRRRLRADRDVLMEIYRRLSTVDTPAAT